MGDVCPSRRVPHWSQKLDPRGREKEQEVHVMVSCVCVCVCAGGGLGARRSGRVIDTSPLTSSREGGREGWLCGESGRADGERGERREEEEEGGGGPLGGREGRGFRGGLGDTSDGRR
jgi:hypothetical protein